MGRVHVEVGYWLSESMVPGKGGRLLLEDEVEESQALRGFLEGLPAKNSSFGEMVYDPQRQELYPWVQIIYDGRLIEWKETSTIILADGDRIGVQPIYTGG